MKNISGSNMNDSKKNSANSLLRRARVYLRAYHYDLQKQGKRTVADGVHRLLVDIKQIVEEDKL